MCYELQLQCKKLHQQFLGEPHAAKGLKPSSIPRLMEQPRQPLERGAGEEAELPQDMAWRARAGHRHQPEPCALACEHSSQHHAPATEPWDIPDPRRGAEEKGKL